jgi:hypothetical protein
MAKKIKLENQRRPFYHYAKAFSAQSAPAPNSKNQSEPILKISALEF